MGNIRIPKGTRSRVQKRLQLTGKAQWGFIELANVVADRMQWPKLPNSRARHIRNMARWYILRYDEMANS